MIDQEGFRDNIGIILFNEQQKVFLAKRIGHDAWQFPQGGVDDNEDIEAALFRELYEEVGLDEAAVKIVGHTKRWLRYKVPKHMVRKNMPFCVGQKQRWYLLKFLGNDSDFQLNLSPKPEFDGWDWVNYWYPLRRVIFFKREVYRKALLELAPLFWKHSCR